MNLLDVVLLVAVLVTALRGFRRGALVQLGSLLGAISGLVAGFALGPGVAGWVVGQPGPALALVTIGVVLAGLIAGQALGVWLGASLGRGLAGAGGRPLDQVGGLVVSVATLALAVWLLASILAQGPSPWLAQQITQSRATSEIARLLPPPPDLVGRVGAYLDQQGFPQAVAGLGAGVAAPVDPPDEAAVEAAVAAAADGAVRVRANGCDASSFGSGFAVAEGFVVTNAHVVAGADEVAVDDRGGARDAVVVHLDVDRDLAVLRAEGLTATTLGWAAEAPERGQTVAILGYPGGGEALVPKSAAVRSLAPAVGRDIYGRGRVDREVLTLSASVEQGDSGAALVTPEGTVAGVVFASSAGEAAVGYALSAGEVRDVVAEAVARDTSVGSGACRF